jgi:sodium/potassium/calcium exchanger 6
MAGVTFLAFGNGSPDVFSTFAAMNSHSGSLALGELIGAAGFISAVVAGSMTLVREFKVAKKTFVRDVGFFIVAVCFTMVSLADGALHLGECAVMIGFYLFYVATVVVWHWYLSRRRRRREREAAARGHYLAITNEEEELAQDDGNDEDAPAGGSRYRDVEDFGALERGASPAFGSPAEEDSDEDEDEGLHLAAEMASNMRVTRPTGSRRNTITPIRPSLVGALEFRSVLSSLQKSRGSHARPIHLRRYSEDGAPSLNQLDGPASERYSDNGSSVLLTPGEEPAGPPPAGPSSRIRAVSMNDAATIKHKDPAAFSVANVPDIGVVAATPTFPQQFDGHSHSSRISMKASKNAVDPPKSLTFSISPPPSNISSRDVSPSPSHERKKRDTLAPPEAFPGERHLRMDFFKEHEPSRSPSLNESPRTGSRAAKRPKLQIPGPSSRDNFRSRILSPVAQFPPYTDSPVPISARSSKAPSLVLPDSTLTPESVYIAQDSGFQERPIRSWPYRFLPSPHVLGSTLFPTLWTWRDKSIWDKLYSVVAAPSYFLLAITLPVVEAEPEKVDRVVVAAVESYASRLRNGSSVPRLVPESPSQEAEPEWDRYQRATDAHQHSPRSSRSPQMRGFSAQNTAGLAISEESNDTHAIPLPSKRNTNDPVDDVPNGAIASSSDDWNRWLVGLQIFTAPLFVVIIIWANSAEGKVRLLVQLVLYSLLGSLVAFAILTLTTTPSKPPKYRILLCFLGFIVSIAWISTIANEVVGVLKAFGVILGISDAILGLTIFAVGNSLGDLIADITVARLGYPVMALSACFGGPMLNILLGIGIGGLYMTIKEANRKHDKHPGKNMKYKPYEIEVSGTLLVSAITLLVTLVGLLIVVPMNKWMMNRRIGWGLIILWAISTVVNLTVELSGAWGDTSLVL